MGVLAANADAGSDVDLVLENNDGLGEDDFIVIGYQGNELCEMQQVSDTDGDTGVEVATLKFNHKKGEPVVKFSFNKRKFYGATSADGEFTELTGDGSPKPIQVDDPMGTLFEYTGSTYTYFKSTYFNSETSEETDIDDAVAVLADESARYADLYAIAKHAGLAGNSRYSQSYTEDKRKQAENEIDSVLIGPYVLPLSEIPGLIRRICILLAAGYIDYEEFGKEGEGVKWLAEARALLKQIADGRQRLIGSDKTELERNEKVDVLSGYPNDEGTDKAKHSMADRF